MLDSSDALIEQFLNREKKDEAMFYATSMIYDAYFTMNKDEWLNQDNKEDNLFKFKSSFSKYQTSKFSIGKKIFKDDLYNDLVGMRFAEKLYLHDEINTDMNNQIIVGIKNRMFTEGMILETLTFGEWIKQIENM